MPVTVVRYKTKPERADENQALIEKVFAELNEAAPAGLRYASLRLEDGVSFIHIASVLAEVEPHPLTSRDAFGAFVADLGDRCAEPPVVTTATVVGAFELEVN